MAFPAAPARPGRRSAPGLLPGGRPRCRRCGLPEPTLRQRRRPKAGPPRTETHQPARTAHRRSADAAVLPPPGTAPRRSPVERTTTRSRLRLLVVDGAVCDGHQGADEGDAVCRTRFGQMAAIRRQERAARAVDLRARSTPPAHVRGHGRTHVLQLAGRQRCREGALPAADPRRRARGSSQRRRRRPLRDRRRRPASCAHVCVHRRHGLRTQHRRRVLVRRTVLDEDPRPVRRRTPAHRRQQTHRQGAGARPGARHHGHGPCADHTSLLRPVGGGHRPTSPRARRAEQGARSAQHVAARGLLTAGRARPRRRAARHPHDHRDPRIDHSRRLRAVCRAGRAPAPSARPPANGCATPGAGNGCTTAWTRCSTDSGSPSPAERGPPLGTMPATSAPRAPDGRSCRSCRQRP